MSQSLNLARQFLGKEVNLVFDRPIGTIHHKFNFKYLLNYGYVPGVKAPDGEDLDAFYMNSDKPLEQASGVVIAIVHRLEDDDDKLIVVNKGVSMSDEEIEKAIHFQEQWFKHEILRS